MKSILSLLFFLSSLAFAGDRVIINPENNGDLKIKANIGGTATDVLTVLGTTGEVSAPKGINRTEDTVFAFNTSQALSVTQPAITPVTFASEITDTTSAFTSNTYTCKQAGRYLVTFSGTLTKSSGTAPTNTAALNARIVKNATTIGAGSDAQIDAGPAGSVGPAIPFSTSYIITLAVNDTVGAEMVTNFSGGQTWVGSLLAAHIVISRI